MRYSALAECQGGKPKTIFTWNKWLSAVNAVNGFTECVNEYQRIFLWNKTLRLNGFTEVVQTRSETPIMSSSHSQMWTLSVSEKNSKKHRNWQDFFLLYLLRLKVKKFTGVHPVYSRAYSLHVHSTTVTKMKSLKWFYLHLIYTFFL